MTPIGTPMSTSNVPAIKPRNNDIYGDSTTPLAERLGYNQEPQAFPSLSERLQPSISQSKSAPLGERILQMRDGYTTGYQNPLEYHRPEPIKGSADLVAQAIAQVESGNKQVKGASGEFGAYQFMPATWEAISKSMEGKVLPQTPENERRVATKKIDQLFKRFKAQGMDDATAARNVALIWNTSLGGSEVPLIKKGTNAKGVKYDSEAYARKVTETFNQLLQSQPQGDEFSYNKQLKDKPSEALAMGIKNTLLPTPESPEQAIEMGLIPVKGPISGKDIYIDPVGVVGSMKRVGKNLAKKVIEEIKPPTGKGGVSAQRTDTLDPFGGKIDERLAPLADKDGMVTVYRSAAKHPTDSYPKDTFFATNPDNANYYAQSWHKGDASDLTTRSIKVPASKLKRGGSKDAWQLTEDFPAASPSIPKELEALADNKELLVVHNLTEEKLRFADKIGGLANPSTAVINPKLGALEGFGDITLIANKNLIRGEKTHLADAYSPRFPSVHSSLSYQQFNKLSADLEPFYQKIGKDAKKIVNDDTDIIRYIENNPAVALKFLDEKGIKPTKEGQHYFHSQIQKLGLENEYQQFLDNLYKKYGVIEQMFAGYTPSGNRRYRPVSVDEASKIMSKQKDEGFNYGLGSFRAKVAPVTKSPEIIKKEKGRLITKEEFEKVRDSYDKDLWDLKDKFEPFAVNRDSNSFTESERQLNAIGDVLAGEKGALTWLRKKFPDIPQSLIDELIRFREKLRNMPTEYFETKFKRPVSINEFQTALVPEGTTPATIKMLEDKGIEVIQYKSGERSQALLKRIPKEGFAALPFAGLLNNDNVKE